MLTLSSLVSNVTPEKSLEVWERRRSRSDPRSSPSSRSVSISRRRRSRMEYEVGTEIDVLRVRQSINYNHLLPTRYALDLEGLKGSVAPETFKEVTHREDAKKAIKLIFESRYLAAKSKWFFTPLRVRFPYFRKRREMLMIFCGAVLKGRRPPA